MQQPQNNYLAQSIRDAFTRRDTWEVVRPNRDEVKTVCVMVGSGCSGGGVCVYVYTLHSSPVTLSPPLAIFQTSL